MKYPTPLDLFIPGSQEPNYSIPLTHHIPSMFSALGFNGKAIMIAWGHHRGFGGEIPHPSLDLFIPTFQDTNYHISLTHHTPSMSSGLCFNRQGITIAWGRHRGFWGEIPHRPLDLFILASQHPNYHITLTHHPPSMSPILGFNGQAIMIAWGRHQRFRGEIPHPTRSFHPGIPGAKLRHPPHPPHSFHVLRPRFQRESDTDSWGQHRQFGVKYHPLLDLFTPASQDLNYGTPHPPHSLYVPRPQFQCASDTDCVRSIFGFGGEIPAHPRSLFPRIYYSSYYTYDILHTHPTHPAHLFQPASIVVRGARDIAFQE